MNSGLSGGEIRELNRNVSTMEKAAKQIQNGWARAVSFTNRLENLEQRNRMMHRLCDLENLLDLVRRDVEKFRVQRPQTVSDSKIGDKDKPNILKKILTTGSWICF